MPEMSYNGSIHPIVIKRLHGRFDLHYFYGLANQYEAIRLTIGTFKDVPILS